MQRLGEMQILNNHVDINNNKKKTAEKPVSCVTEKLWLTWWLEEPPLPFNLPLLPTAVALLRRACSWSNSRSSRRWVKASFCWMAIRNREFRVFFSSSAAASCLCMSSSWVTYSSHLRENQVKRERKKEKKNRRKRYTFIPAGGAVCRRYGCHMFSPFSRQQFPDGRMTAPRADSQKYYIRLFPQCTFLFLTGLNWQIDSHTGQSFTVNNPCDVNIFNWFHF